MLDTSFESEKNTENVSILTILCFLPQLLQTILEGLKEQLLVWLPVSSFLSPENARAKKGVANAGYTESSVGEMSQIELAKIGGRDKLSLKKVV
jgi:hypothetical protein